MYKYLFSLLIGFMVISCGSEPTLDGTSPEALKTSMAEMKNALATDEANNVDEVVNWLFMQYMMKDKDRYYNGDMEELEADARASLNGMTYDELVAATKETIVPPKQ